MPAVQQLLQWRHLKLLLTRLLMSHAMFQIASEEIERETALRSVAERRAHNTEAALSAATTAARVATEVPSKCPCAGL